MDRTVAFRNQLIARMPVHLLASVAVALMALGVVSALAERGPGVCMSSAYAAQREAYPGRGAPGQCIADMLAADVTGRLALALHLRGNCQMEHKAAMITTGQKLAWAAPEQAQATCLVTSRS
jgi:hypothetical protein